MRVVEATVVPKTYITGSHLATVKTGETEPSGQRIIEVPDDLEQLVNRDTRARSLRKFQWAAYTVVNAFSHSPAQPVAAVNGRTANVCYQLTGPAGVGDCRSSRQAAISKSEPRQHRAAAGQELSVEAAG